MDPVEKFLARLKDSHPDMGRIFTNGGCYELFLILRTVWPEARCYYAINPGHVYTMIGDKFYDIHGKHVRLPDGAIDLAYTEPQIMAKAHRWSKRVFGEKVGRLMTARELLGIPEPGPSLFARAKHWMANFLDNRWVPVVLLGVGATLQVLAIVVRHWGH